MARMRTPNKTTIGKVGVYLAFWVFLFGTSLRGSAAEETPIAAPLNTDQVVERMVAMNQRRFEALRSYTATRVYHLEVHGLINKQADVVAKITYHWPDRKEFTIVSEGGSKTLRNRVLKRLQESEVEATQNQERTAIRPRNYQFRLVDYQRTPARELYVLEVTPKVENKFLFRGRIWVDGKDFAIVRLEGEPAKNPSWWTTRNDFQHSYEKLGDFWLPARNETVTQVRIFGQAFLTIAYKDYKIIEGQSLPATSAAETSQRASLLDRN